MTQDVSKAYNKHPNFWDRAKKKMQSDFICRPQLIDRAIQLNPLSAIDIGCGEGYVSRALAREGIQVTAIDASEGLIQKALERERSDHLGIEYSVGDARELQAIANNSYDLALSVLVMGHMDRDEMILCHKQAHRVLKKEGRYLVAVPHPGMYLNRPKSNLISFRYDNLNYFGDECADITLHTTEGDSFDIKAKHHTTSTYVNTLVNSGFTLEQLLEPRATIQDVEESNQTLGEETTTPSYLIMEARK